DLAGIWEHILAPETLGDILSLDVGDAGRFRFPDELWARAVYDFALGHHYSVVHRDHLLRSLVPLYLGRTAAFVATTRRADAAARWQFTIEAMADPFRSWLVDLAKRVDAGQDVASELLEGAALVRAAADRASGSDASALREYAGRLARGDRPADAVATAREE